MKLNPYLCFDGKAEEALHFYAKALEGKITELHRWSQAPFPCPDSAKQRIMHGGVEFGDNRIMLSDTNGTESCTGDSAPGSTISLSLNLCGDAAEADARFAALAAGGEITLPMQKQFWGAYFGMLTDRFGIRWMVNCELNQANGNLPARPLE